MIHEELSQRERRTIKATRSMLTIFFNSTEFAWIKLLPHGTLFTAAYFVDNVIIHLPDGTLSSWVTSAAAYCICILTVPSAALMLKEEVKGPFLHCKERCQRVVDQIEESCPNKQIFRCFDIISVNLWPWQLKPLRRPAPGRGVNDFWLWMAEWRYRDQERTTTRTGKRCDLCGLSQTASVNESERFFPRIKNISALTSILVRWYKSGPQTCRHPALHWPRAATWRSVVNLTALVPFGREGYLAIWERQIWRLDMPSWAVPTPSKPARKRLGSFLSCERI
jgi:hypothetical protein